MVPRVLLLVYEQISRFPEAADPTELWHKLLSWPTILPFRDIAELSPVWLCQTHVYSFFYESCKT